MRPCLHSWDLVPGTDGTRIECSRCGTQTETPADVRRHIIAGGQLSGQSEGGDVYSRIAFMTGVKRDDVKRVMYALQWTPPDLKRAPSIEGTSK